ncbi:MAG: hypothetical protein JRJ85_15910, partial [Deltaproteobacteria bacterium]|nr:hypothetical protein [Deltaproteobacteria bacterium]
LSSNVDSLIQVLTDFDTLNSDVTGIINFSITPTSYPEAMVNGLFPFFDTLQAQNMPFFNVINQVKSLVDTATPQQEIYSAVIAQSKIDNNIESRVSDIIDELDTMLVEF